jgi:hypothetical protein
LTIWHVHLQEVAGATEFGLSTMEERVSGKPMAPATEFLNDRATVSLVVTYKFLKMRCCSRHTMSLSRATTRILT